MLCASLRGNRISTGRLFSCVRTTQGRPSIILHPSLSRGYAAVKPPPVPKSAPRSTATSPASRRNPPRTNTLTLEEVRQSRKIELAKRLYQDGKTTLFQSTSRLTRYRITAWILASAAFAAVGTFWSLDLFNINQFYATNHEYPKAVVSAYFVTGMFLVAAAGWAFRQSAFHIHKIDLVQKSGVVFLQVTVRRPLPFLKRSFLIRYEDMKVDDRIVAMMNIPGFLSPNAPSEASPSAFTLGVIRESLRSISRFFYNFFDSARTFFSREGIATINIERDQKVEQYYLDVGGQFLTEGNGNVKLWELVDSRDPYEYR